MESQDEHQRGTSTYSSATVTQENYNSWGGGWKPPLLFLGSQEKEVGVYLGGPVSEEKANKKQV